MVVSLTWEIMFLFAISVAVGLSLTWEIMFYLQYPLQLSYFLLFGAYDLLIVSCLPSSFLILPFIPSLIIVWL